MSRHLHLVGRPDGLPPLWLELGMYVKIVRRGRGAIAACRGLLAGVDRERERAAVGAWHAMNRVNLAYEILSEEGCLGVPKGGRYKRIG